MAPGQPGGPRSGFGRDRSVLDHRLTPGTLRRILGYARPHRRQLALFVAVIVASALVTAAPPLLLKAIVDDAIAGGDRSLVFALAGAVAVLAVVGATLTLVQRWCSARIGEGLIYDLRTDVFSHVQRQPIAFFSRTQTGALVSRLNGDVLGAQQAFTSTLSGVVGNLIGVTVTIVAMASLSWQITLLALAILPLFVIPARIIGRRLAGLTRQGYELNADMGQSMTERFTVSGALLVKLYGDPEREFESFSGRAARVRDIGVRTAMYGRVLMVALSLVAALAGALVYGLGGSMAIDGSIGVGTLVALAAYLGQLYGPLTSLSNVQVDVMTTLVSFERIFEVLDLEPAVAERPDAAALPAGDLTVDFDDVTFAYPGAEEVSLASLEAVPELAEAVGSEVLSGLSLHVPAGAMVALVGPSGAGKTTITTLVSRLYDPSSGAVRLGGVDLRDVTLGSIRERVGVVSQDAHLFHDTLRANLLYAAPEATDDELRSALRAAQILALVERLPDGLDTVVGDRGYRLSGGERQRLAIARLLLTDPSVVVLDEATAHLDATSEAAVQAALGTALAGRTSLVIAHRLATVRRADEILVVDEGRIVERGTHAELVAADGLYAELSRTQFVDDGPSTTAA